jgi:hypothetical protein
MGDFNFIFIEKIENRVLSISQPPFAPFAESENTTTNATVLQ